jgi:aspartate/methionine/tyrosine aminotransferase
MHRALASRATSPGAKETLAFVTAARELEAAGQRISRLDIGEPHLPTPPHIVEAALTAMRGGATKYVSPQGLPHLRELIAASVQARGITVSANEIVVTSGVKPMLLYALLALVQSGDEVLVPDPGYPGYAAAARLAGASVRTYRLAREHEGFEVDLDSLRASISPASRVLILNSPHNPTGMTIDEQTLRAIAEIALAHDLWIVSDEIYNSLTYDQSPPSSIASLPGVVVDGFSKAYAMTGWRLGFGVLPPALVPTITAIVGDASTCTPPFVQHAGVAALRGPQDFIADMRREYRCRRDALIHHLERISGVSAPTAAGALYIFADVGDLMDRARVASSAEVATGLLYDYRVSSVPGSAFGGQGERYLRFSFAVALDQLDEALLRLAAWGWEWGGAAM